MECPYQTMQRHKASTNSNILKNNNYLVIIFKLEICVNNCRQQPTNYQGQNSIQAIHEIYIYKFKNMNHVPNA
jgi:hypothetical protein